jgi:hypothetical protein
MASVGFGSTVATVAPASSSAAGRRRPQRPVFSVPATVRGGKAAAAAKEEKSFGDFIRGLIFRENQLLETDPLLNKVDAPRSPIPRGRSGTTAGKKGAASSDDSGGGGFSLGGLFAKKD